MSTTFLMYRGLRGNIDQDPAAQPDELRVECDRTPGVLPTPTAAPATAVHDFHRQSAGFVVGYEVPTEEIINVPLPRHHDGKPADSTALFQRCHQSDGWLHAFIDDADLDAGCP